MDVRQCLVMIRASLPTIGLIVITDHEPRTEDNKLNSSFLNRVRILFDSLMTEPEGHKSPFIRLEAGSKYTSQ